MRHGSPPGKVLLLVSLFEKSMGNDCPPGEVLVMVPSFEK